MVNSPTYLRALFLLALCTFCFSCSHALHTPQPSLKPTPPNLISTSPTSSAKKTAELKTHLTEITHTPWHSGNRVSALHNGQQFYPAMLKSIKSAKHSITFETFAFVNGPTSYRFAKALAEKAKAGVAVRVILDSIGSKEAKDCIRILENSPAKVLLYRPLLSTPLWKLNARDHRKILIVDGHTLFTGGAGFAESWQGNGRNSGQWRDSQFRLQGPGAAAWQHAFTTHWQELTGEYLAGEHYFPKLSRVGSDAVQIALDSSTHKPSPTGRSILYAIRAATSRIELQQSYFIPTDEIITALNEAAARGVRIRILTPSSNIDFPLCRIACRLLSKRLSAKNISLYEYQPSMMHAKIMLVDDHLAILGSGNMDSRSFFINLEANLHVISPKLVKELREKFEQDLAHSLHIQPKQTGWIWHKAPSQSLAWILRHQL